MSPNPRKRAAPGASPIVPIPISTMQQQQFAAAQPDPLLKWNGAAGDGALYADAAARNVNPYMMPAPSGTPAGGQFSQAIPAAPSTALARRGLGSRALVPTAPRQVFDSSTEPWNSFGDDFQQQPPSNMEDNESIEALEERALRAKREAMGKRKQIPPFVQKLSSFLDESKNTELIRWSDKGDSFIVIDEDEFAKKLIPELFKHNNYASFVRQLNMYGFHKRVGLSDNSMKASERKNKSPSEYYNQYFKRGHPNLLWLINKPKSGGKKGKDKKGDEIDSDDDGLVEETYTQPSFPTASNQLNLTDIGQLPPKKDLVLVKTQLEKLQQQQLAISQLIERLRREHAQLMTQAAVFQNQHERHENSINAILNFLANVFRKSLEEQGGAQSVSDLLASIIPGAQSQMPQGSVVDLGDFDTQRPQGPSDVSPPKRQQRLLPPIPLQGKAPTVSPSTIEATTPQSHYAVPMGSVTELFDASPSEPSTPAYIKNELQTNPHEGMMKIINDTNAGSGGSSRLDLPDMASKTNATMSHEQRNKMLNMMAGRTSTPSSIPTNPPSSTTQQHPAASMPPTNNNGLSPILSSVPPPSMYQMQNTQAEIDALQQMQRDQAAKIHELSSILGPLSPLRHVPDADDNIATANNGYFDGGMGGGLDEFLDPNAFADMSSFNDLGVGGAPNTTGTDGNDFNFGLDGGDGGGDGGVLDFGGLGGAAGGGAYDGGQQQGYVASSPERSSVETEEIPRDELASPGAKRRRL
ncbi:hypothetical protein CONLIGDRAFT_682943 [Coniochaeta ligniaria NRRL 30616]|uniref:HSF-type DNA-binding domain-containing protein n=1 Tax=Coniochaeta ligniaria NRRL 30616 TaxID=1408157 RepID=A0A1J7IK46_9PEZI|nr:hypothetical protein CONLIGDRAFT_682943 [Coniochaeta ligniaria NRRL 30616]